MKKNIFLLVISVFLLCNTSVYAELSFYNYIDVNTSSITTPYVADNIVRIQNGGFLKIIDIAETGADQPVLQVRYSDDCMKWESIFSDINYFDIDTNLSKKMFWRFYDVYTKATECQIIKTEDGYLARGTKYDSGFNPRNSVEDKPVGGIIYIY